MAAKADPNQLSPKFTWPLIVGVLVLAGGEAVSLITVDAFAFAGAEWASVLHKFVTVAAMAGMAFYKADPLRANFAAQAAAERARQEAADSGAAEQVPENVIVVEPGQPVPYIPPAGNKG